MPDPSLVLPGDVTPGVTLDLRAISVALRAALYAATVDTVSPTLEGVHIYWKGGTEPLVIEATDSYRLHQVRMMDYGRGFSSDGAFDVIVPGRWLRTAVAELASDPRGRLSFDGGTVTAVGNGEARSTSLIPRGYPAVQKFVDAKPEHHPDTEVAVNASFLQGMLEAAALWPDSPIRFTIPENALNPIHVTINPPNTVVEMILMPVRLG